MERTEIVSLYKNLLILSIRKPCYNFIHKTVRWEKEQIISLFC